MLHGVKQAPCSRTHTLTPLLLPPPDQDTAPPRLFHYPAGDCKERTECHDACQAESAGAQWLTATA